MKQREYTDEELLSDIRQVTETPSQEDLEREAWFNDPANAQEIAERQARMDMVVALYNARKAAGLTQAQVAEKMGTKQTYVAQLERGRRNLTLGTLVRFAAACGKRVAFTLL